MLIKNLYTIDAFDKEPQQVTASVTLNAAHKIFEGHFPGQPVLPGVCQLQMVKELLEQAMRKKLFLSEAASCKFLQMISPEQTPALAIIINYEVLDGTVACNAVIKSKDAVHLKLNSRFAIVG